MSHIIDDSLEARARRRVGIKLGFIVHAAVFVVVNLGLFLINTANGGVRWHHFPLWGWGLGLAIHGLFTFLALQGDGFKRSMVEREIAALKARENR